jgi:ribosome-associated protein
VASAQRLMRRSAAAEHCPVAIICYFVCVLPIVPKVLVDSGMALPFNSLTVQQKEEFSAPMPTAQGVAARGTAPTERPSTRLSSKTVKDLILQWLDDAKAEEIVEIDLTGKSTMGDFMVIASGKTDRHVGAIVDQLQRHLKDNGFGRVKVEGMPEGNWVLLDQGDIIVHVFRPEVREFYNLEKMWSGERPADTSVQH